MFLNSTLENMSGVKSETSSGCVSGLNIASAISCLSSSMLSGGRMYLRDAEHITMYPGLAIMITILAFNLLGDGLRDALDPKLKR